MGWSREALHGGLVGWYNMGDGVGVLNVNGEGGGMIRLDINGWKGG